MGRSSLFRYNGTTIGTAKHYVSIDRDTALRYVEVVLQEASLDSLKDRVKALRASIEAGELQSDNGNGMVVRREALLDELDQIIEARSFDRASYYTKRLRRGLSVVKTNGVNDINLNRWKEYDEVFTDSLWNIDRRDGSGTHLAWYWGNFIPQIPHQLMLRYTKRGDLVLDPFVGSGTTLIECRRLGRHGIGLDINSETLTKARERIEAQANPYLVNTTIRAGDSRDHDLLTLVQEMGFNIVDLLILHPPYHDIIKFTSDRRDLSNAQTTDEFLEMFGQVLDNTLPLVKKGGYVGIVIGDKYHQGKCIPLGFHCMQEAIARGLLLKGIVVKNFEETKGKRNQKELWRYRALTGGFYVFKHEYVQVFQK